MCINSCTKIRILSKIESIHILSDVYQKKYNVQAEYIACKASLFKSKSIRSRSIPVTKTLLAKLHRPFPVKNVI